MGSVEVLKAVKANSRNDQNKEIVLRPFAGPGWWLCALVPISYLINSWKHQRAQTFAYKLSTIISIGLLIQSLAIFIGIKYSFRRNKIIQLLPPILVTSTLIYVCLKQDSIFSTFVGCSSTITYNGVYFYVLKHLPKSFTFGEASIVVQGFTIFLLNVFIKLVSIMDYEPINDIERMSTILEIGLLGITFIVGCCHFVSLFQGFAFYSLLAIVLIIIMLFPIGDSLAIIELFEFIFNDLQRLCMITLYLGLLSLTIVTVMWQMQHNNAINTRVRKIFHILIVFVFIPGLMYQCTFLFVASGIALALLILLETIRIIRLKPICGVLEKAVQLFTDEKDAGTVALTPIYLLVGCSIPLWLHPCPCDLTDAAGLELLPLLSGVISVGLGDTAASVIGSSVGRFYWPNTKKTVEGTLAAICIQALVLPTLIYAGFVWSNIFIILKFVAAIVINSLVETFTDQIDNLVLPLITFIILSF